MNTDLIEKIPNQKKFFFGFIIKFINFYYLEVFFLRIPNVSDYWFLVRLSPVHFCKCVPAVDCSILQVLSSENGQNQTTTTCRQSIFADARMPTHKANTLKNGVQGFHSILKRAKIYLNFFPR